LKVEQFIPVTAPYDFATLCRVASTVLQNEAKADQLKCKHIDKLFKDCLSLNDQRVRIVHGSWSPYHTMENGSLKLGPSATHVSRGTLRPSEYFKSSEEVEKEAEEAHRLVLLAVELFLPPIPQE
jgi:hypothetical protein